MSVHLNILSLTYINLHHPWYRWSRTKLSILWIAESVEVAYDISNDTELCASCHSTHWRSFVSNLNNARNQTVARQTCKSNEYSLRTSFSFFRLTTQMLTVNVDFQAKSFVNITLKANFAIIIYKYNTNKSTIQNTNTKYKSSQGGYSFAGK